MKTYEMKTLSHLIFTKFCVFYIFQPTATYSFDFANLLIIKILCILFKVKLEAKQLLEHFQNFTHINILQL